MQPTVDKEFRTWAMLLHLSVLLGYFVPLAGLVAPILIWQVKKSDLPGLDAHGRVVANWLISLLIYALVGALLTIVLIGVPILIALAFVSILFPIIGGIKANNGELWPYPGSITFFK